MTLLEYITDLQSKGLSSEEIFAKAQEFKGRTKPEEVIEEVVEEGNQNDSQTEGADVDQDNVAPQQSNTEFILENGSLDLRPQGLSSKKGGFGAEGFFDNVIKRIDYNENYEKLKKEHQQEQVNKVLNKYEVNTPERAYAYYKLQLKPDDTIDIKTFNEIKLKEDKPKELTIDTQDFNYFNEDALQDPIFKAIGKNLETSKEKIKQIEDYKKDFLGIEKFDKEASLKEGMRDEEFFLGEEMRKSFLLGAEGVKSSFLALPEIVNDFKFATVIKALDLSGYDTSKITEISPEVIENFKKISPSAAWTAISSEAQESYEKSLVLQQQMQDDLYKFELETMADEFSEGNWSNVFNRTVINLAQTMPALFQSMTPVVGLPSLFATTAATANAEVKRNEDYSDLSDFNRLLYAGTAGTAEALLERYTVKLGNSTFKSLFGKPKDQIITSLRRGLFKTVKQSGGEMLSETGTLTLDKLGQYIFLGDKQAYDNSWKEYFDTAWGGLSMGFSLSGTGNAANFVRQTSQSLGIKNTLKNTKYDNIFQAFDQSSISKEIVELAENPNAQKFLNNDVDVKVEKGEISIEEGNNVKNNFIQTQQAVNQIKPLNLSDGAKPEIVNLLKEKNKLSQEIKQVNEAALTEEQSTRVNKINKELNDLVVKDKTAKIDAGATAVAEQLEVGIETFDTTEDTAGAIETLKNQGGKVDVKNSTDYGTIVEIPNDQGGIDTQIIINKQEAAADNVVTTSQHEVLHAVLSKTTKGNPDATIALGKSLLNELRSDGVNLGGEFESRLDQYVKDPNISEADVMEEVMTLASEGLTNGEITINESTLTKIGNAIKKFFGLNNLNIRFNTGKDVLNFIRDYNKSVQKGKGLSKSQLQVAKEGAKGKLIDNAKVEAETIVTKQSKSPQGEQASAKVQEIYDAKGKDGAFEIIEQFEPIVSRIVEKRSEAPNFDRQLLTDEINTGKRGIIDLVAEYKPESGVPLAAYINKFLPARAIEASQRVLGEEFTTDVTEARGVIAEETKQPETVVSRKVKKPSETTVFDKATETRIDEAINKNFKGDDVKFSETKNIPKEVADIYAESLGINPETIVDKRRNYSKKDAEGLTKAKQLLLKNAKDDYARLPELKDDFGKGTFVPKNVKDALYTDGKLTGSLKDYIDLIRQKPVKPIYRDRVGQTIRGLLNLTIRNRILETAQPLQAKRLQSGAKFSKKTGVQQQQINTVKKYGVTPIDQTAEGTSRVVDFVENELPKAFGNRTNLIAKSSNLAGAGNSATTEKGGGALGRGFLFITDQNKTRSKDKLKTKELLESGIVADLEISRNKINKKGFGLKDADKEAVKLLNLAIGSQKGKAKVISNQKLDDGVIDLSKKEFYDGIKKLMKNDRNNIAALQFILGNQNANSGLAKNLATLNNDATQKGDKSYEEHWFQTSQFVSGLIKSLTKGTSTLDNFIKFANKNYYQEIISKETQGIVDKSYDITLDNGDVVKWKSQNENHPLLVKALDKAIKTNKASDWAAADKLSDLRKYPGPNIHSAVNPFLHGRNGVSDAVRYGINVSKIDQSNVNIQYAVNSVIHEVIVGDITSKQASERIEAYLPIARLESKASKKNTNKFGDKVNNEMTVADQLTMLGVYDKAASVGRKLDTPKKGISVFDFDDTLAETKEKVIVNNSDGTTVEISAAKFAEQASDLETEGATFDFSNFEKVGKGTQKGPLADLALKRQGKFGSKDIFVLTARPQIAAEGIKKFLDGIGLSIPLANITGLENGSPGAKGNWVAGKAAEGYNDFYFADDAYKNVQAVQEVLSQIDVNSVVQIAKSSKKVTFDKIFNDILESSTGIESYKEYSAARAQTVGASKGKFTFFNTPSAEDFTGLLYKTLGKGKIGDAQMAFYKTNLLDPYNRAELAVTKAKITAANDFKSLKRNLKTLPKSLSKQTGIGGFTFSQASRVAAWTRQGMNIPGLSKRDVKELNDFVDNNAELNTFVDELIKIQKGKPYPKPGKSWLGGTITSDILNEINKVNRKAYLQEWQENVDIIFSDKNMNKLEAAYGPNYVEALRDQLARMKSGSNRPIGGSRVVNNVLDWLNNSVGAVMFLNTRSAVLQTLSSVNFINFGNNNIYKAGKAFANQPQFWKDFKTLMNSPYLVERRNGLKINVSESEIADAVAEASNKPKAAISYLLNKGFIFTRIADSFAIAAGGSTFYRNQLDAYVKDGMNVKEAEKRAFDDFYAIAEENQQSSNPSKISQQQASGAGRVILAFANTPMQYARIIKRSSQDLINKRGDWKSNVSKIVYYAAIQNIAFNALQSALFADAFGEEEDDEKQDKTGRIANGMADSLLRGLGIQGAAVSALKNSLLTIANENDKKSPKFVKAVYDLFDFSPPIDSKFRKLRSGANTITWERENIKNKGFDLNNPAYLAGAQVISGLTNIPLDRAIQKINNIRAITSNSSQNWQKVAMALGWSTWDVGLPYYGVDDKVEITPEMILKEKVIVMKKETNTKQQKETLLKLGLTKQQIKALKYEEARVKKIIELQEKKDGKN